MIADEYGYADVPESFTRKQLLRVLRQHDVSLDEFDAEHATADAYAADTVLAWLGY